MTRRVITLIILNALVCLAAPGLAPKTKSVATFRGFAVNRVGGPRNAAGVVDIAINRWSTDEERDALITTLKEKGSKALLEALVKLPPVGYIKMSNTLGWDLYYGRQTELPDGGRKVVLATNRRLSFGEVSRQARSADYDFTLLEMHFDKSNKGEGKMAPAAKISFNSQTHQIEIENYGVMPVLLKDIRHLS